MPPPRPSAPPASPAPEAPPQALPSHGQSPGPPHWPRLQLRSFDRGDGLLGLRPCGPVPRGRRTPLFGARGPQVTLAWCEWPSLLSAAAAAGRPGALPTLADRDAAHTRLRASGLHPLPPEALQWRGSPALPPQAEPWSLVREGDFGAWRAEQLPALRTEGWPVDIAPGFAHAAEVPDGWRLRIEPLAGAPGLGGWLLSLGIVVNGETLDLVPLMTRLLKHDRRWLDAEALAAIADDDLVRLVAPGGRVIDAPAAPLKAIARALLDLLSDPRRREGPLTLAGWATSTFRPWAPSARTRARPSSSRAVAMTRAPVSAYWRTSSRPMPREAPMTRTVLMGE